MALIYLANAGWGFEEAVRRYWAERYDEEDEEEEGGSSRECSDEFDVSPPFPSPLLPRLLPSPLTTPN